MTVWPKLFDEWKFHRSVTIALAPILGVVLLSPLLAGAPIVQANAPAGVAMLLGIAGFGAYLVLLNVYSLRVALAIAKGRSGVLREMASPPFSLDVIGPCIGFAIGVTIASFNLFAAGVLHAYMADGAQVMSLLPTWLWLTIFYGLFVTSPFLPFALYIRNYTGAKNVQAA